MLVHQVAGLIFANTDVLILSLFAGLREVSVYSLYALVFGMVKTVSDQFGDSYLYALGQTYHTDRARFLRMFDAYEAFSLSLTFGLFCVCRRLILPFLQLYTAGITDIRYADPLLSWLFTAYYLLHVGRVPAANVISNAQRFEDTKKRAVLESCINLTVSLAGAALFGIYGVLLGTIAALLYRANDMVLYTARLLDRSAWITYRRWLVNIAVFLMVSLLLDRLLISIADYAAFLKHAILLCLTVIPAFLAVSALAEPDAARFACRAVQSMFRHPHAK
ncbi:MAG: hypothetical protein IJ240_06035 [Clostridia bacterium]|nr:hypothetical protein [Clostridia bacterium]